ncbi:MAG: hypothetical protein Q9169_005503 [Polycauliona sp. 2 TL-2023]
MASTASDTDSTTTTDTDATKTPDTDVKMTPGRGARTPPEWFDNIYFVNNPMVQLKVGAEETLFHVHQGLICGASPFFNAAFTGGFKENSGSMLLPEAFPATFGHIVQWLYRRKLETLSETKADTGHEHWDRLFRLYLLADKYCITQLKNHVMDLLFKAYTKRTTAKSRSKRYGPPSFDLVALVYENSIQGSQLRRFITTYYSRHIDLSWYKIEQMDMLEGVPAFGAELVLAFALKGMDEPSPFEDPSSFQEVIQDQQKR